MGGIGLPSRRNRGPSDHPVIAYDASVGGGVLKETSPGNGLALNRPFLLFLGQALALFARSVLPLEPALERRALIPLVRELALERRVPVPLAERPVPLLPTRKLSLGLRALVQLVQESVPSSFAWLLWLRLFCFLTLPRFEGLVVWRFRSCRWRIRARALDELASGDQ